MLQTRAWATSMRCQMNGSNPKQHTWISLSGATVGMTTLTRAAAGMSLNALAMFPKHMTNLSVAYVKVIDVTVRRSCCCSKECVRKTIPNQPLIFSCKAECKHEASTVNSK